MAHLTHTETAKPIRNLSETSFAFLHSFGDRNLRNLLPIGSGGEVSPHPLAPTRPLRRFGAKACVHQGNQKFRGQP
jgi:hypothetical protein